MIFRPELVAERGECPALELPRPCRYGRRLITLIVSVHERGMHARPGELRGLMPSEGLEGPPDNVSSSATRQADGL